jgi:hypothetical protein
MTGPFVPVGMLNLIRAVMRIHNRFNLFVKCSRRLPRARQPASEVPKTTKPRSI